MPVYKIRGRYQRLWSIVADAIPRSDTATFWDNSYRDGPDLVALFGDGLPIGSPEWPSWTSAALTDRWPREAKGN